MSAISFVKDKALPHKSGRTGKLKTPHGVIETPAFVVVGTKATVKGISPEMFDMLSIQAVLANTYHLYLEPGDSVVAEAGGLHSFMGYDGPTMTDSGGFQVFSLGEAFGGGISKFADEESDTRPMVYDKDFSVNQAKLARIDEEGVTFTSHLDGSTHRFTAERSIEIQHNLGADIMFAFDECTSPSAPHEYQKEAMDRTHRWAKRSITAHRGNIDVQRKQGLFGIVQGGRFEDLREESAKTLADMDFDGYGIGGSFSKRDLDGILELVSDNLPQEKPRHLLGIGEPIDLFIGVEHGMDTFDCVLPTRLARTGTFYTSHGKMNILNASYRRDFSKVTEDCSCYTCSNFTKAYLAHLFRSKEMLGATLASLHNIYFLTHLVDRMREAIGDGTFFEFKDSFLREYKT